MEEQVEANLADGSVGMACVEGHGTCENWDVCVRQPQSFRSRDKGCSRELSKGLEDEVGKRGADPQ